MSRWGKPIKNKKHKNPRYFLNESIDLQEQDNSELKLKNAKKLLDNGTIDQKKFDQIKSQIIKSAESNKEKEDLSSDLFGDTVSAEENPDSLFGPTKAPKDNPEVDYSKLYGPTVSPDNPEGETIEKRMSNVEKILKQLIAKIK